jgi:hypothetical protein
MPKKRRRWRFDPDPERMGRVVFFGALLLYGLSLFLPLHTSTHPREKPERGYLALLYGAWGLLVVFFWFFLILLKPNKPDFLGWLEAARAEIPWLANPLFFWALWHFRRGRVRASWITTLIALGLALTYPILSIRDATKALISPAYLCWLSSMVWLAAGAGLADYLAYRSERRSP